MNKVSLISSIFKFKKSLPKEDVQEEKRSSSEAPKEFQKEDLPIRSTRSVHEEHSESSSHGYEHSAISSELQHFASDSFMKGGK